MTKKAKNFLHSNDISLRGLARKAGLKRSTVCYNFKHSVNNWKVSFVLSIAKAVDSTPDKILNQFLEHIK